MECNKGDNLMEMLFKWIPQIGFPIAVAIFVLIRIEPKLISLTKSVDRLIPIVEADSTNTKGLKNAITELRLEIAKMNHKD